jgi:hypothetical protein
VNSRTRLSDEIRPLGARDLRSEFLRALEELETALAESTAANQAATLRAAEIRALLDAGMSVSEIVLLEQPPLIVELTSDNVKRLYETGGKLRRLEALALHEEGMTMDTIARLFGVSRQRVSALVNDARS